MLPRSMISERYHGAANLLTRFSLPIPEAPVVPYSRRKSEKGTSRRSKAVSKRQSSWPPSGTASPNSPPPFSESRSVTTFKTTVRPMVRSKPARDPNHVSDFGTSLGADRLALAFHDTWFEWAVSFRAKDFKFSVLRYNDDMAG